MSADEPDWRQSIVNRLRERSRNESRGKEIILQNNRLIDQASQLTEDNLKLHVENEKLRTALSTGGGKDATGAQLAIAALEKKLLAQQEELTELHKRKGENSQMIVDLSLIVEQQKKLIAEKDKIIAEQKTANISLRAEVDMLKSSLEQLKKLNATLLDEHTALKLSFSSLEEKLRGVQDENRCLLDRFMRYKSKDADKLNEENENFLRKRSDKLKRDLEDAVREPNSTTHRNSGSPSQFGDEGDTASLTSAGAGACNNGAVGGSPDYFQSLEEMLTPLPLPNFNPCIVSSSIPTNIFMKFEAHDNETHAVKWSPVERLVATGGGDRKVKLWDVGKGALEPRAVLGGSSAGINSVDFDSTGSYILGTSNDYGARVWTVSDNRLRHTLTGHSGKVMAAKYLQEPIKVVTGSHDRTLKVWDLRSIACIETKFAGSSCNDLVTTDSLGSTIISGHYDKKLRFWDIRTEKQADDILMPAKITSIDMTKDGYYLICSIRDDTIKLIDLRKNQIISSFSHENFKLSCDWARASFNTCGSKLACGSADGLVYIWSILGDLEATLKGHNSAVNAVSWCPNSNALATVGKGKRCIIYTES
uniref:Autophagy-related protein 16-1 n=2 Tax=Ceratitis capitata TaxID=7213 RepID=W8AFA4_CERCA